MLSKVLAGARGEYTGHFIQLLPAQLQPSAGASFLTPDSLGLAYVALHGLATRHLYQRYECNPFAPGIQLARAHATLLCSGEQVLHAARALEDRRERPVRVREQDARR